MPARLTQNLLMVSIQAAYATMPRALLFLLFLALCAGIIVLLLRFVGAIM